MMIKVRKSNLGGAIAVPPSKSQTLRAILFGTLGKGKTMIRDYLCSDDAAAMISACRLLGAEIKIFPNGLEIEGVCGSLSTVDDVIDAKNSGIVFRFLTAISALSPYYTIITGDRSIRHQRPIQPLLGALRSLGAVAESSKGDGFAPVVVRGPIRAGSVTISGEDSQPVSALLIASAFLEGVTEIFVENPGEKPWISLTLHWFDRLGIQYQNHNFSHYCVFGKAHYAGFDCTIGGDWSSALFPIAAALITNSELTVTNVEMNEPQGDKKTIAVLQQMGAVIEVDREAKSLTVRKNCSLRGIDIDANDFVDSVPILAVIACYARGTTRIRNVAIVREKECDRLSAMADELKKMGAKIVEKRDGLEIQNSHLIGTLVDSHSDHRIAISLLAAGLGAEGETLVGNLECTSKSFPDVVDLFRSLGANIEKI